MNGADTHARDEAAARRSSHFDPTTAPERLEQPELADLLVRRATIAFEELKTQWSAQVGLGTHERMAVSVLWIHGSMQMSELAARIGLSRAAVTTLVDRLENEGWARRTGDPHDRRRTIVVLEPKYAATCGGVSAVYGRELRELAGSFDEGGWQAIARFLEGLTEISLRESADLRASGTAAS